MSGVNDDLLRGVKLPVVKLPVVIQGRMIGVATGVEYSGNGMLRAKDFVPVPEATLLEEAPFLRYDAVKFWWGEGVRARQTTVRDVLAQIDEAAAAAKSAATKEVQQKDEPGLRYDAGKPRFDLVPSDAFEELTRVYTWGAVKYGEDNWAKGMSWRRCFGSLMRHSWAWLRGEDVDQESGLHHMAHAAWNAFTLIAYAKRRVGTDDRFKG